MTDMEKLHEEIYAAYKDKVSRYIKGKVSNPSDVEDLVSDVFLKTIQNYRTFDEKKASLSTWIYMITKNTVIDFYRKSKPYEEIPEGLTVESIDGTPLDEGMLDRLSDALCRLKQRDRDIIILHYYSGYTLKEIAEKTGMSYSNTKILHKKALKKLQKWM